MSKTRFAVSELSEAISDYMRVWDQDINEAIDAKAKENMTELVKKTKATAPVGRRQKHYRDSIKSKSKKSSRLTVYTWYVDGPDYRLSHLLENGHALRNGGRVEGTHFIKKAADPILEQYVKDVEEILKNG